MKNKIKNIIENFIGKAKSDYERDARILLIKFTFIIIFILIPMVVIDEIINILI